MTAPLTPREHQRLGAELHRMHQFVVRELCVDTATRYGKTSNVARSARRLEDALSHARCLLDSQYCRDHPDEFDTRAYYPGAGAEQDT